MTHPFSKMFERALRIQKASEKEQEGDGIGDNLVLLEAESLRRKGYSSREIYDVLAKLSRELVAREDSEIVSEALEEFSKYLKDEN